MKPLHRSAISACGVRRGGGRDQQYRVQSAGADAFADLAAASGGGKVGQDQAIESGSLWPSPRSASTP